MKIVFLADWNLDGNSGVLNKIESQIAQWDINGHEVHLWFVSAFTQKDAIPTSLPNVKVFDASRKSRFLARKLALFWGRARAYAEVLRKVKLLKPDIIYYRQGMWYPFLCKVLKMSVTVMELNTDDVSEAKFMSRINRKIYLWGRIPIINSVKGFIGVTQEIANKYVQFGKPTEAIANGIELAKLPIIDRIQHQKPHLFFVGTPGQLWHGVDKIIKMAYLLPEFNFSIAGTSEKDFPTETIFPSNLKVLGYLNKKKLFEVYKDVDIAISTLALHRKDMEEACSLKTREYVGLGFPIILGYNDSDLNNFDEPVLKLPNTETNVIDNIDKIRDFVYHYKDKVWSNEQKQVVDIKAKEKERLQFFRKVIAIQNKK